MFFSSIHICIYDGFKWLRLLSIDVTYRFTCLIPIKRWCTMSYFNSRFLQTILYGSGSIVPVNGENNVCNDLRTIDFLKQWTITCGEWILWFCMLNCHQWNVLWKSSGIRETYAINGLMRKPACSNKQTQTHTTHTYRGGKPNT